jgi:hypothetical protein
MRKNRVAGLHASAGPERRHAASTRGSDDGAQEAPRARGAAARVSARDARVLSGLRHPPGAVPRARHSGAALVALRGGCGAVRAGARLVPQAAAAGGALHREPRADGVGRRRGRRGPQAPHAAAQHESAQILPPLVAARGPAQGH